MSAKSEIVEAFFKLYSVKDLEHITTKEIIDLADCNRSTFYGYYFDKFDVLDTTKQFILHHIKVNASFYLAEFSNEEYMGTIDVVNKYAYFIQPLLNKDYPFLIEYKDAIKSTFSGKFIFHPFDSPMEYIDDQVAATITYQTFKYVNNTINQTEYLQSVKFLFQNTKVAYPRSFILDSGYETKPTIPLRNGKTIELVP